jgi:hypothetical protein
MFLCSHIFFHILKGYDYRTYCWWHAVLLLLLYAPKFSDSVLWGRGWFLFIFSVLCWGSNLCKASALPLNCIPGTPYTKCQVFSSVQSLFTFSALHSLNHIIFVDSIILVISWLGFSLFQSIILFNTSYQCEIWKWIFITSLS